MEDKKFNPQKLDRLNNPERKKEFPIELIIKEAALDDPKGIIDIGAGTGFFSIPFAEKYKGSKVYACDISDTMLDWMKYNILEKHSNIIPVKMDENKTPLDDEIADLLFMVNLHHELHNPEMMLKECYRLLKPKSTITISDWRKEETENGPSVNIRVEPGKVKEQLISAGFENVRIFKDFPNNFLVLASKI